MAQEIGNGFDEQRSKAIGLERNGEIVAGVIYENFTGKSFVCHIAVQGRITPAYVAAIFHYPFCVAGAEKLIAPVASGNHKSIRLVTHMGFREEARISDAHPKGDIVFFTLARSACRFLGGRYGRKIAIGTGNAGLCGGGTGTGAGE